MKKLLMILTVAGFMTAGLSNSFGQDDPSKTSKNGRKTTTEESDGTIIKEKDKKNGTVKEVDKNKMDGTKNRSKTYEDGTVKQSDRDRMDQTKSKSMTNPDGSVREEKDSDRMTY